MAKKIVNKKTSYTYSLERVITGKFSYELPRKRPESFEVSYTVTPIITSNTDIDKVFIRLNVIGTLVNTNDQIVSIETLFVFHIKDLKKYVTIEKEGNIFPVEHRPLLFNLINISISTVRGILIEKLNGTVLSSKIVPIINPYTFYKEPN